MAIRQISEVPDFHYFFFCSPDYYTVKQKYFYVFCALEILLENMEFSAASETLLSAGDRNLLLFEDLGFFFSSAVRGCETGEEIRITR